MYAVIQSGGKQYRVEPGEVLEVELLDNVGEDGKVVFDQVLMVGGDAGVKVGQPVLADATVSAHLVREMRGPKLRVFKKKRRKQYRRTNGHRQYLAQVRIEEIAV